MAKHRTKIPEDIASNVRWLSDDTCCVCRERRKGIQIHHIDGDPQNHDVENLAVLCLECHNKTEQKGGFARSHDPNYITRCRNKWLETVNSRREEADKSDIKRRTGEKSSGNQPKTALIEKIIDAGYMLYEPHYIKKVAKAQADAAIIEAESQIKITDLHRRAAHRWIEEEAQRQKNMEDITEKATHQLNEDADPHAIENDWITKFFRECRGVSDDKMQDLWASILAGEANSVGSYSPKTLLTLASMDNNTIRSFNYFCSMCIAQGVSAKDIISGVLPSLSDRDDNYGVNRYRDSRYDALEFYRTEYQHYVQSKEREILQVEFQTPRNSLNRMNNYGLEALSESGLLTNSREHMNSDYRSLFYSDEVSYQFYTERSNISGTLGIFIDGFHLSQVGCELFSLAELNRPDNYIEIVTKFLTQYDKSLQMKRIVYKS